MTRKTTALIAVAAAAAVIVAGGIATVAVGRFPSSGARTASGPSTSLAPSSGVDAARSATDIGRAFLADWVEGSGSEKGRVVRRDQGGDTVSEGQAYGMLTALGVRDEKSFAAIWSWTRHNLQRSDGLLAWRWQNGKVVDDQPASDADLDTARALVLAGKTFDEPSYTKAGTALGGRILDELTASTPDGRILLPGLWAQSSGPWSYNPSYASPATFDQLATATKDPRWRELASGSRSVTTKILQSTALPSDWAQVKADGSVVPLPSPTGSAGTVQYGYDAGRVALRYAESCSAPDVALAAKLAGPLGTTAPLPMQLDLGGTALNKNQRPLAYVARAAARASAGDRSGAQSDLRQADVLAQTTPTYYGAAWDALGALQLEGKAFGTCSPLEGQNS
jgi:endo-1,4-beta-D-glucanase Y